MGRRSPRGAGWRVIAVMTLLIALVGLFPHGVQAASGIAISVTDDAGTPLAGAAFGVYAASVDIDGTLFIDKTTAALLGGPVVTDDDGYANLPDLPDGLTVGVKQLAVPDGYLRDPAGDQFVTTDPLSLRSLAFVNAVDPAFVADEPGVVTVAVTEETGTVALDGVTIEVRAVDPATGIAGEMFTSTVSDAGGVADLSLPAGAYLVSVVPPGGYLPAAAQSVVVGPATEGVPADASLTFGLQPDPSAPAEPTDTAVPTDPPTPAPTETSVPTETPPTATTEPTATPPSVDPTAAPSAAGTEPAASDGSGFVANQPAFVRVRAIVCTSNEPELIGAMQIRPNSDLVDLNANLPPDCRPATAGEFTFVFRDPRRPSPWDDISLGLRATDADGVALFDTTITRDGQSLFVIEQANQNDFSDTVRLVPNDTVSLLAIKVVGEPKGDVIVRPIDAVSGAAVAGACYDIAAAGLPDVALASACDADDGNGDGVVSFPAVANGSYVVVPSTAVPGYVLAPATPLTVDSQPVDLPQTVVPYGTLQLLARSCLSAPPGVTIMTPTPASGDGIDGLDDVTTDTLPETGPGSSMVVFQVVDGSAVDAAGTGLEGETTATDCTAIAGSLTLTAPDGTVSTLTVGQDGVASPLSLPPTFGDARYVLRDDASGTGQGVVINPAGTTTVTLVTLPGGTGSAAADDAGATGTGNSGIAATGAGPQGSATPTGQAAVWAVGPVSSTDIVGRFTAATADPTVSDATDDDPVAVRLLPKTGAGILAVEARGHALSILIGLSALLAAIGLIMATTRLAPSWSGRRSLTER